MRRVYIYVVDRDFGFAPNPFHGYCSLATCKQLIRAGAKIDDWVIGMGGSRLKATGRCIFAMRVTKVISFNEYWSDPHYRDKRPVRNGSSKMLVGDNIYHYDVANEWHQADSHHSNADGTANTHNLQNDTKADRVLISNHFFYFGKKAPNVPEALLNAVGYRNRRNYRVFEYSTCLGLINWLQDTFGRYVNYVMADPFDFAQSGKRYSYEDNKIK
ncbi:MAG: hypothetical protein WBD07_03295 [Vicinamibacterales bacterium]